jgi:Rod binding domain-containing protein
VSDVSFSGLAFDGPELRSVMPDLGNLRAGQPLVKVGAAASGVETAQHRKLREAAGQFESMLLSNLWKSMKSSFEEDDGDFSDPAHGALDDWSMEAMCSAVGKSGGLGIGRLILKHLEPKLDNSQNGKGGV